MRKIFEFNEYKFATTISDLELMEMANVSPKKTGLKELRTGKCRTATRMKIKLILGSVRCVKGSI
jgi:hypothetical protein